MLNRQFLLTVIVSVSLWANTVATDTSSTTSVAVSLTSTQSGNQRSVMWLVGDPHLYSAMNGYQVCSFTGNQTCLSIPGLTISCTASAMKTNAFTSSTNASKYPTGKGLKDQTREITDA
jgi:hypothetical protein